MFLKQLDVLGFKSFARKVGIEFGQGVTAVVGPNGSGKSNITDAIKWVLGEQSARSLRGGKMEDIIFSGSDHQDALNMAEVTLTLDNSDQYLSYDFSEVSVTRRVFRSGESEFLLNGGKCRLKDIIELFMDSGLGREAYSIISQGKIDEILNSKPEEKRKIFEEAAGVLKYKVRKENAEKKLAVSDEHLTRVEDILHELEAQAGPLKVQAEKAERYELLRKDRDALDIGITARQIEMTHSEWEKLKEETARLSSEETEKKAALKETENKRAENEFELQSLDAKIDRLQSELLSTSENLEKVEGQKNVLSERKKHARENADDLHARIKGLKTKKAENEKLLKSEKQKLAELNRKVKETRKSLKDSETAYHDNGDDLIKKIDQVKSDYIETMNEEARLKNEARYIEQQKQQIFHKLERLKKENKTFMSNKKSADERFNSIEAELEKVGEDLSTETKKKENLEQEQNRLKAELANKKAVYEKIVQFIRQAGDKKKMLEDMARGFAGYFDGVKQVLKAKKHLTGVIGPVAELLEVKKEYETAIETALGAAMQNIVVQTEADGRSGIAFLKQKKAGRATFLPLSVIKDRTIGSRILQPAIDDPAFIGTANSLVGDRTENRLLSGHLLGAVIIARDLAGANRLAGLTSYRFRIVTLDGDVVNPGGAMTGGSRKSGQAHILGRSREIEQLEKQMKEMKEKSSEVDKDISAIADTLEEVETKRSYLMPKIENLEEKSVFLKNELKDVEFEKRRLGDHFNLYEREQKSYTDERQTLDERLMEITDQLAREMKKEQQLNQKIERLNKQKEKQDESKSSLEEQITAWKIELARQEEYSTHQKERTENMLRQMAEINEELSFAEAAVGQLDQNMNTHDLDHETLHEKISSLAENKQQLKTALKKGKQEREALAAKINELITEEKREQTVCEKLTNTLRTKEIALERADVLLDNLFTALREEHGLTYEKAAEDFPLASDVEDAKQQLKDMKAEISKLGSVNTGAIEEYERVREREAFLNKQRDDLLEAKQTLRSVIDEMDGEVIKRFGETFYQVNAHFQDIFVRLFGGGKAELVLIDPEDLLYSGVNILAQPPGKKLQPLSLLSGGERAMTAIALLFAILKVRPVPFCVLDEVEAALDDANVDRYAAFLKSFSAETQFIVVTHRRGTMEKADILYGVTMQESGVSNLVSVKLEDTRELVET